jgi:hypothetical protein
MAQVLFSPMYTRQSLTLVPASPVGIAFLTLSQNTFCCAKSPGLFAFKSLVKIRGKIHVVLEFEYPKVRRPECQVFDILNGFMKLRLYL